MRNVERLCLAHFWVAFAAFLAACFLGTWQMWVRSPLGANIGTPGQYFMAVTAHGVSMAYILTIFFIMVALSGFSPILNPHFSTPADHTF